MSLTDVTESGCAFDNEIEMFYLYPETSISKEYEISPVFSDGRDIVKGISMYYYVSVKKDMRNTIDNMFLFKKGENSFLVIIGFDIYIRKYW